MWCYMFLIERGRGDGRAAAIGSFVMMEAARLGTCAGKRSRSSAGAGEPGV